MNNHSMGGNSENTHYVGMDHFGNKYYECFDAGRTFTFLYTKSPYIDVNQRRWVEYNDFLSVRSPNGDRIPPKWHGWLHQMYDDVPVPDSQCFHDPFFERPHQWESSTSGFKLYTSRLSPINGKYLEYQKERLDRQSGEWEPKTKRLRAARTEQI